LGDPTSLISLIDNEEGFIRSAVRQSVGVAKSHCGTSDKTG
jgi:hypothetical protein